MFSAKRLIERTREIILGKVRNLNEQYKRYFAKRIVRIFFMKSQMIGNNNKCDKKQVGSEKVNGKK